MMFSLPNFTDGDGFWGKIDLQTLCLLWHLKRSMLVAFSQNIFLKVSNQIKVYLSQIICGTKGSEML